MKDETRWAAERELEFMKATPCRRRRYLHGSAYQSLEEDVWRCATLIDGAPTEGDVFHAYGEDSLQALLLAVQALAIRLKALGRTGTLTWFESSDLGLPEPDTATDDG